MVTPIYPALYQVNTRLWIQFLSRKLGRAATLDDIPDSALDEMMNLGFDWVYCLGVWQTGAVGPKISRSRPEWLDEYRKLLPDLTDQDICGSCFAIQQYQVSDRLGGNSAMERLRDRLHQRGLKLMLDFVPNHMAPDHGWVQTHPEYFVQGTEELLAQELQNYCQVALPTGNVIFAYGRDPYFDGWPDTLQLNYGNPSLQAAMVKELLIIAQFCDGVRCDMAMLILPDVFQRTWGITIAPFWPSAIPKIRSLHPGFTFMAEVYWDLEWTLQQQGFNYTYDKRLYDRLREQHAVPVGEHFRANLEYQQRSARFLENHDEPRAAATFPADVHRAAAILTFLCPGLRFFHQGQLDGYQKKISVHLQRGPEEPTDPALHRFYRDLLTCLRLPVVREGIWHLLNCTPAWDGNWTWNAFIGFSWDHAAGTRLLIIVNYAPHTSQCNVTLPYPDLAGKNYLLKDLMSPITYERSGDNLISGLYFELPGWGYHVFELQVRP